jgi:hypothetical protein
MFSGSITTAVPVAATNSVLDCPIPDVSMSNPIIAFAPKDIAD